MCTASHQDCICVQLAPGVYMCIGGTTGKTGYFYSRTSIVEQMRVSSRGCASKTDSLWEETLYRHLFLEEYIQTLQGLHKIFKRLV